MSRFIPTPLDWTIHPTCVQLREEDPAYPDRWLHLIRRAHIEGRGGSLTLYDGLPLNAESLSYDHDRNCHGWDKFLEFCLEAELLEKKESILSVSSETWKEWYRAPSQYPEVEKHRRDASRKKDELESVKLELALAARERDELKKRLKAKADPNQLKLEIESEERPDRIPDQSTPAERDPDSLPAGEYSKDRSDRVLATVSESDPDSGPIQEDYGGPPDTVPSCPELSGVVQSCPDNRSTSRNTCKSRDNNTRVVSFDENVSFLKTEDADAHFWQRAERLCSRVSKKAWTTEKKKLERALKQDWAQEYPGPEARWWTLASAVQETVERLKDGEDIKTTWGYAISILHKYASFGAKVAWQKSRGESASFVRLKSLEGRAAG